jgi:succinate dehydrogenase / fumarate reductase cytochrome b subunit
MTTAVLSFYGTSIGKKVVMAVTGFIAFGFVVAHMLGNLQIYQGPDKLNHYAEFLKSLGGVLWLFRAVVLVSAVLHIIAATQVTLQSWRARPRGYRIQRFRESTYAARTMRWGGPILGLFVIYHLLHLTWGLAHPKAASFDPTDVYNNVVLGFQVWWVSAIYIAAVAFLGPIIRNGTNGRDISPDFSPRRSPLATSRSQYRCSWVC